MRYAAKIELKEYKEMGDLKTESEPAILDNKIATFYRDLALLRRDLIIKAKEIDLLKQELKSKNHDLKEIDLLKQELKSKNHDLKELIIKAKEIDQLKQEPKSKNHDLHDLLERIKLNTALSESRL